MKLLGVFRLDSANSPFQYFPPLRSAPSEPPEAYIDNKHYEKDTPGCQLGVGGTGVQVFGIAPVLLRQAGQVAGFGV